MHPEQMHLSHEFVGWLEGGFVCSLLNFNEFQLESMFPVTARCKKNQCPP